MFLPKSIRRYKTPVLGILASLTLLWGVNRVFYVSYDDMLEVFMPALVVIVAAMIVAFVVGGLIAVYRARKSD